MANGQQHIIYTAADFERYYNGSMPEAEMYALEKAALEDPFLSDALEGYEFAATPVEDIQELAAQIPPVKEENKKAVVVNFKIPWARIAAILVLTFGIGYIVLKTNRKDEPVPTLASTDTKAVISPADKNYKKPETDTSTAVQAITSNQLSTEKADLPSSNGTLRSVTNNVKETSPVVKSNDYAYTPAPAMLDDAKLIQDKDANIAQAKQESDLVKRMYQKPGQQYFLEGKVMDDQGSPVPFATISSNNNTATTSDANGNFSLQSKDSLMLANISAAGYAAVNQNFNLNNQQNITLRKDNLNLSEVVVTAAGTQKSKKSVGYSTTKVASDDLLQGKASGLMIQPVDGMDRYDKYMDSIRQKIPVRKTPLGEVSLSFKVNKKGQPIDIKVEKSLTPDLDKEAIRLLKEGPKWQYSHGHRASKSFAF